VLGGVSEEELDVKELIGVVGREPVPGRDTCNGRVEVPGAEEGWEEYNPAFVTEGDRRRVGKGGARDILDRLRMVVVMFKHKLCTYLHFAIMYPPFLRPLHLPNSPPSPCKHAQFVHNDDLGSSHALWWPPSRDNMDPDILLYFLPGALPWKYP